VHGFCCIATEVFSANDADGWGLRPSEAIREPDSGRPWAFHHSPFRAPPCPGTESMAPFDQFHLGARSYHRAMDSYVPFLTRRFDLALQFASGLHHHQARKGGTIPYIAHLMSVCAFVLEAGGDEDQAIAALLHDAMEDQGGLPTLATIRHMFGDRVANAVDSCSDSTATDPTEKPPWRKRKVKYLEHLQSADKDALIVSAADKLHNARAVLSDYRKLGDQLWLRFNAPKEDQLWFYGEMVKTLQKTAAPKTLVDELESVVNELKGAEDEQKQTPELPDHMIGDFYLNKEQRARLRSSNSLEGAEYPKDGNEESNRSEAECRLPVCPPPKGSR